MLYSVLSCSADDDTTNDYQTFLSVTTAEVPETIEVNTSQTIVISYNKPTNCHVYTDMFYENEPLQATMAVISTYVESIGNCAVVNQTANASFKFEPKTIGTHVLKFWQGKEANNQDIYLIYEIEVTN